MERLRKRWAPVVVGIAAALVLCSALLRRDGTVVASAPIEEIAPAVGAQVRGIDAVAPAHAASVPVVALPSVGQPAAAVRAAGNVELNLCGVGRVQAPPPPKDVAEVYRLAGQPVLDLPFHLGAAAYAPLRDEVIAKLHAGTPREQAAAWMLQEQTETTPQPIAALAELARRTADPVIWRWLSARCPVPSAGTVCEGIHLRGWSAADPGNLMAWFSAAEGGPGFDAGIRSGAISATHFSSYDGTLAATALRAMPEGAPAYLRSILLIDVMGLESAFSYPLSPLKDLCKPPRPGVDADAERQLCRNALRVMTQASDNLLGMSMGARLGETRDGWPAAEVARLQAELAQLGRLGLPWGEAHPYDCTGAAQFSRFVLDRAQYGELGQARRVAAARAAATAASPPR